MPAMTATMTTTPLSIERLAWLSATALVAMIATAVTLSHQATQHSNTGGDFDAAAGTGYIVPSLIDDAASLPPLFPLRNRDYVGYGLAIMGLIIAAGGGIGGGGILVPVYTLVLQFPIKHAIPLTAMTILGGAMANNLVNCGKQHPLQPNRSLIDWDVILMLEPTTIAGAILGALLHEFLPALVIVVLLLVLLLLTAYLTLTKAVALYQKETQAHQLVAASLRQVHDEQQQLILTTSERTTTSCQSISYGAADDSTRPVDPKVVDVNVHENVSDAVKLTALFVVVTAINLFKGGLKGTMHGVHHKSTVEPVSPASPVVSVSKCGASCFWASNVAILVVIGVFTMWTRNGLLRRLAHGGPVISDIAWNERNSIVYPVYAIVAGIVAGLFGIGGGIVKGPLMLALGVHPAVASATSACMIFFTSCTSVFSFMLFNLLTLDYAIAFLLVGFVSTLVGQTVISILMQRNKRHSYIAFSIGIVIALSAICMTAESVLAYWAEQAAKH